MSTVRTTPSYPVSFFFFVSRFFGASIICAGVLYLVVKRPSDLLHQVKRTSFISQIAYQTSIQLWLWYVTCRIQVRPGPSDYLGQHAAHGDAGINNNK